MAIEREGKSQKIFDKSLSLFPQKLTRFVEIDFLNFAIISSINSSFKSSFLIIIDSLCLFSPDSRAFLAKCHKNTFFSVILFTSYSILPYNRTLVLKNSSISFFLLTFDKISNSFFAYSANKKTQFFLFIFLNFFNFNFFVCKFSATPSSGI